MPRRTLLLLAGCLGLLAASAAGAQTSSTTATSSSVPPTTLPPLPTTMQRLVNPCAIQPCKAEPPVAFLAGSGGGEVQLDRGSWCWSSGPDASGLSGVGCADFLDRGEPKARLVVQPGQTLILRFSAFSPTSVLLQQGNQSTPLPAGNPTRFQVDLPLGLNDVSFVTRWLQGDASYRVGLDVRAAATLPATPQTGPLSLTG